MINEPEGTASSNAVDATTLGELLGYAGAATALVGLFVLITGHAASPSRAQVAWAAGSAAAGLLAAGVLVARQADPRAVRLRSVLWFLSAQAALDLLIALLVVNSGNNAKTMTAVAEVLTAIYAGGLWVASRRSLQQIAFFLAVLGALLTLTFPDTSSDPFGFSVPDFTPPMLIALGAGIVWLMLGWRSAIRPRRTAMVLGAATMSFAPFILNETGHPKEAGAVLALVGLALVIGGHLLSDRAVSGIGIVDLLLGGTFLVASLVADRSSGVAGAALVIGVGMLALAAWLMRPKAGVEMAVTPPREDGAATSSPPPPPPPIDRPPPP